ncbi:hypothetical protein AB0J52_09615 [Spirillospora sp. NPDC049652]
MRKFVRTAVAVGAVAVIVPTATGGNAYADSCAGMPSFPYISFSKNGGPAPVHADYYGASKVIDYTYGDVVSKYCISSSTGHKWYGLRDGGWVYSAYAR